MTVGVIGDTHIPFDKDGYLDFVKRMFKRHKVSRIVHIGDLVDNHAISYHESDPDGMASGDEASVVLERLRPWKKAFPRLDIILGNHDKLPERKAKTAGLSNRFVKSFAEQWQLPKGWTVHPHYVEIDGVKYLHGMGATGKNGALNMATSQLQSCVIGHSHAYGGVSYRKGGLYIFGLNVGCGIDEDAYAFEYGKYFRDRPTLGCGIVKNGTEAIFVPWEG